jgi:hypothetical protein
MTATVCAHGSLARQCELCERDATIAHLSSRLTAAETALTHRYALRREIEAALGIASTMASDEALAAGLAAVRRLVAERNAAQNELSRLRDVVLVDVQRRYLDLLQRAQGTEAK